MDFKAFRVWVIMRQVFLSLLFLLWSFIVSAQPSLTAVSNAVQGADITITGSSFGVKAHPYALIVDRISEVWVKGTKYTPNASCDDDDEIQSGTDLSKASFDGTFAYWETSNESANGASIVCSTSRLRHGYQTKQYYMKSTWEEYTDNPVSFVDSDTFAVEGADVTDTVPWGDIGADGQKVRIVGSTTGDTSCTVESKSFEDPDTHVNVTGCDPIQNESIQVYHGLATNVLKNSAGEMNDDGTPPSGGNDRDLLYVMLWARYSKDPYEVFNNGSHKMFRLRADETSPDENLKISWTQHQVTMTNDEGCEPDETESTSTNDDWTGADWNLLELWVDNDSFQMWVRLNGQSTGTVVDQTGCILSSLPAGDYVRQVGWDPAHGSPQLHNDMEIDISDYVADDEQAAVFLSNQATWTDGGATPEGPADKEYCNASVWSTTSITCRVWLGGLSGQVYAYVRDPNGNVNSSGFALTLEPSVTACAGLLVAEGVITCTGTNFGSGASNVIFEDFEGTLGNSVAIGSWTTIDSEVVYGDNAHGGSTAARPVETYEFDAWGTWDKDMGSGQTEIFISYWYNATDGINPGSPLPNYVAAESAWKPMWVKGDSGETANNDIVCPTYPSKTSSQNTNGISWSGNGLTSFDKLENSERDSFFCDCTTFDDNTVLAGWVRQTFWSRAGSPDPKTDDGNYFWSVIREGSRNIITTDTENNYGTGTKNPNNSYTNNLAIFEDSGADPADWNILDFFWMSPLTRRWDISQYPSTPDLNDDQIAKVSDTEYDVTPDNPADLTSLFYTGRRVVFNDTLWATVTGQTFEDPETTITVSLDTSAPSTITKFEVLTDLTGLRYDDIRLAWGANSAARVVIGNASTWAASTKLAWCVETARSDTSVTCTLKEHSVDFEGGETLYLFVIDGDNTPSAGYDLTALKPSSRRLLLRRAANDPMWEIADVI